MYCIKCGNKLSKTDKFCGKCGYNLSTEPTKEEPSNGLENINKKLLFGVIGFFAPIGGIILYFASKETDPEEAKNALTWALIGIPFHIIGFCISVALELITNL